MNKRRRYKAKARRRLVRLRRWVSYYLPNLSAEWHALRSLEPAADERAALDKLHAGKLEAARLSDEQAFGGRMWPVE